MNREIATATMLHLLLLLFVRAASAQFGTPNLQPETFNENADSKRFNYFDLEILHELSEINGNFFVSPASMKATLAMILEGANGKCAEEIRNALRLRLDQADGQNKVRMLLNDLKNENGSTVLEFANGIFVSNNLKIVTGYEKKLNENYKAQISPIDFLMAKNAVKVVNSWVNNATHGLITEVATPDTFLAETTMIMLNALYFKGEWKRMFSEKYTTIKCFQLANKNCVNVPMMQVVDTFDYNYIPHLDAQVVVLPYNDQKYAMVVILPGEKSNVQTLTRDLQHDHLVSVLSQLEPKEILVEIPRFEIAYSTDLVQYLKQLKIKEIFSSSANLSGIVHDENVQISSMLHNARIQVNEKGTTAAAVTGAVVIPLMGSSMPRFIANRPFVFIIYHVQSNNIVFEGQLSEPQEANNVPLHANNVKPLGTLGKTVNHKITYSGYPYLRHSSFPPISVNHDYQYNYSRYK